MATELRHVAFFFMGLAAICLVMSFSAYQLTTYDSIRGIIGEIAAQPSGMSSLHSQYGDLQDFLTAGTGDSFTYRFAGSQIVVTRAQVQGKSEQQCNVMVMDAFTKSFYAGTDTGSLSFAYGFVGAGANALYALLAFIFFIIFVALLAAAFLRQWFETNVELLKNSGTVIVAICAVAFVVFLLLPGLLKSMMYNTIYSSTLAQEIVQVLEPHITATFLVNTLIMALVGAVFYGVGFFIGFEESEHEASTEKAFERSESRPHERKALPERSERKALPARGQSHDDSQQKPRHRQL